MILCCGEALIDMLPRQSQAGEPAFAPYPGGAVFNTAIALARLEREVSFFTGLSRDLFGKMLEDSLAGSGVGTDLAKRSDRPTTLALVALVDGQARYLFYDENTAGRMLTEADLPELDDTVTAAFFGGISLMVEPCGSIYEALMLRESERRLTMIDPNIRPSFISDEAAYRARLDRLIPAADIVKLSDEDLLWLMGDGEIAEKAADMVALGPRLVCVTRGSEGALGVTRHGQYSVPARKVTVADTVGAGDTFNAGILASLDAAGCLSEAGMDALTEDQVTDALTLAVKAAAVTVSREGANPPRMDELD
ncbi:MAG: carbohydrate kinase [Pseudomonadota bacterium]